MRPVRDISAQRLQGPSRRQARRVLATGADLLGRATASRRVLPTSLVIGAQRAGTTALHRALVEGGALGPVRGKGVHWFDVAYDRHDLDWYRSRFPLATTVDRVEQGLGYPPVVLETSPYYLFHPAVPGRVAANLPDVRLVAVLRDPAERALSHHHHEQARGFEQLDLADALDAEARRMAGAEEHLLSARDAAHHSHEHHSYAARGFYATQLERWFEHFSPDQVHVVMLDEIVNDPHTAMDGVRAHLGLPAGGPTPARVNGYADRVAPDGVRQRLRRHFEAEDARLAELLGRSLPWR